jgi:hypothetical protein
MPTVGTIKPSPRWSIHNQMRATRPVVPESDTFLFDLPHIGMPACRSGWPQFEAREGVMSSDSIHIIITVGIIALMFSWVPFVNVVCPPGFRSTEKTEKKEREPRQQRPSLQSVAAPPASPAHRAPVSSLSSRRLADQSRDLLNAISARGEREIPRPQPATSQVLRTSVENSLTRKEIMKTCAE